MIERLGNLVADRFGSFQCPRPARLKRPATLNRLYGDEPSAGPGRLTYKRGKHLICAGRQHQEVPACEIHAADSSPPYMDVYDRFGRGSLVWALMNAHS
ncbi:hypothetical protein CK214_24710 [Mesorhizobium sp. WSM3882]|nr:hypothetical protein CK214_24710 [Mesorhizobium sp. WSM3882]